MPLLILLQAFLMTFLVHDVCPAACLLFLVHLTALHTFHHSEDAKVVMHISRVTKGVMHLNNTWKLVLNIPNNNNNSSSPQPLCEDVPSENHSKQAVNANRAVFEKQQSQGRWITYSLELLWISSWNPWFHYKSHHQHSAPGC